jgi:NADP-dependent 3-hydroxy acid dehydrogenase YdfG
VSTDQTTGRVAVITGASSGIGEATAQALAAGGHRVVLLARRADRIRALADELGDGAIVMEADVRNRDSIAAAAERVQRELGGADVLVNNAAVMLTAPGDRVLQLRHDYQLAMREDLVAVVERQLDRKVAAFMSQNHIDPDLAVEVFVLGPEVASR